MNSEQRKKALKRIWSATHRDFKGKLVDGTKTIMLLRKGLTTLASLESLTDEEIMGQLRTADRILIFGE